MKKILLTVAILILIIFLYRFFPIIKNSYLSTTSKTIQIKHGESVQKNDILQKNSDTTGEIKSDSINVSVLPSDCDSECSKFKEEKELKYCQEVCGLSLQQSDNNCESKSNLEKDYCLKELAIKNKDFKICDQISDNGIEKACKNRITEDIIEAQ